MYVGHTVERSRRRSGLVPAARAPSGPWLGETRAPVGAHIRARGRRHGAGVACVAYDEHPDAGIGNHNSTGHWLAERFHVTRGAPARGGTVIVGASRRLGLCAGTEPDTPIDARGVEPLDFIWHG